MKWTERIARALALGFFALLLLALAGVQIQQRLFRHRAERLLSDFHSIRLHQTTWTDAQALMQRWGAWGSAEGPCSSANCKYTILVGDSFWRLGHRWLGDWLGHLAPLYGLLGGRIGDLQVTIDVQDGTVWRDGVYFRAEILPYELPRDTQGNEFGYSLMLSARASDHLHESVDPFWILGQDSQLADHPDFKVGRPGGCEGCISRAFTFTPGLPQRDLQRITAYDLSCFTRYHPCLNPEDVLPVYRQLEPPNHEPATPPPARPCRIPIYARARDAEAIIAVEGLTTRTIDRLDDPIQKQQEQATVRVDDVLKGNSPMQAGQTSRLAPWTTNTNYPEQMSEHVLPGRRYVIFLSRISPNTNLGSDFCGVVDDSPEARTEIKRGLAQNDGFRDRNSFTGRVY